MKKYYIVFNYEINTRDTKPEVSEIDEDAVWDIVKNAPDKLRKVAVYELGKCVFDWS